MNSTPFADSEHYCESKELFSAAGCANAGCSAKKAAAYLERFLANKLEGATTCIR